MALRTNDRHLDKLRRANRALRERGYFVMRSTIPPIERELISDALDEVAAGRSGSRDIAPSHAVVSNLLNARPLRDLLKNLLGPRVRPVRVIYFDKDSKRNWAVPWHQDRIIAVDRQAESAGVTGWTVKNGIPHCEAPVSLLERMLIVRWHGDRAGWREGGLRVLPGSHRLGRLTQARIKDVRKVVDPEALQAAAGDFLLMRPLLVHSSSVRSTAGRRRVLHIDLAAEPPPAPLRWAWG